MTYEDFEQKWNDVETFEDELEMEASFLETLDSPYLRFLEDYLM